MALTSSAGGWTFGEATDVTDGFDDVVEARVEDICGDAGFMEDEEILVISVISRSVKKWRSKSRNIVVVFIR